MTGQLPLDLNLPPRFGRDDFLVSSSNATALRAIEAWPEWSDRVLLLIGPEGAGKSHLAAIWSAISGARPLDDAELSRPDLIDWTTHPHVIDDVDRLDIPEPALFHALNLVRENGASLLLTARSQPDAWGLRTPDLVSRLRLAPAVRIDPPDDDLMRAVLVKLFADRQLVVDDALVAFLIVRLERSLGAARRAVERLDRRALALGRPVTRPMAAKLVETFDLDHDDE